MSDALAATDLVTWAIANRDMVPHLETLTRYAREAQTIVEFGTRGGVSTWAFLDGLPADGRMWSVDIDQCIVPPRVSSDPRWTFIRGDDLDPLTQKQLPEQADLVFIDTSHTYDHTISELILVHVLLKPKRILCHDAEWPGVDRAIKRFCPQVKWKVADLFPAHDDGGPFGLAVLESL